MSLTGQLHGGRLEQWCKESFPNTQEVVGRVVAAARQAGPPVRPRGQVEPEHWADVGGAFGQRFADLVDPAPPYAALLGMIHAGWLSWEQAHAQAAAYPSHAELDAERAARGLSLRRTPDGWLDFGPIRDRRTVDPAAAAVMIDLLERTRAYQTAHAPVGVIAGPGAEAGLARSAWVLAACEGIHRSGQVDERLAHGLRAGGTAAELRAIPTEPAVAEMVALVDRLRTARVAQELAGQAEQPAPGRPWGVAAPTFVPNWADGDVLIGTATSTTLIDIKTVINLSDPTRIARWCWQILLYAWLDTHDLHRVRSVGLYLARHGALVTWGLKSYAGFLLGDLDPDLLEETRRDFLHVATQVILAEGGTFPL